MVPNSDLSVQDQQVIALREETEKARKVPEYKPTLTLEQRISALESAFAKLSDPS